MKLRRQYRTFPRLKKYLTFVKKKKTRESAQIRQLDNQIDRISMTTTTKLHWFLCVKEEEEKRKYPRVEPLNEGRQLCPFEERGTINSKPSSIGAQALRQTRKYRTGRKSRVTTFIVAWHAKIHLALDAANVEAATTLLLLLLLLLRCSLRFSFFFGFPFRSVALPHGERNSTTTTTTKTTTPRPRGVVQTTQRCQFIEIQPEPRMHESPTPILESQIT